MFESGVGYVAFYTCDGSYFDKKTKDFGKAWDGGDISFRPETWAECLRVLKPGGYLLSFGGSRTFHRIACAIEDAGFEISPESYQTAVDRLNGISQIERKKIEDGYTPLF